MKKKIALIVSCLLCFCFVLSGCSLFERNLAKYYNTTVISIEYPNGEVININKKELVVAFNNYGAQLINQGSSYEDALDQTITALVNQNVMLKDSEGKITLSNLDRNNLWKDSYKSILTNMEEDIADIKEEWQITIADESEAVDETFTKYTPYEPTATVVYENGKYVIKVNQPNEEDENPELICNSEDIDVIVDSIYDSVIAKTVVQEGATDYEKQKSSVYAEAVSRYIKLLINSEQGQRLSTDKKEVFKREIKRIYENSLKSTKLTKMEEYISYTTNVSKITVQDVLNKYRAMILASMTKYNINPSSVSTDMLESFANVNYVPNDEYFFVSHILLKFDEENQKKEYDSLVSKKESGLISKSYYEAKILELAEQIVAIEKDSDGKVIEGSNKKSGDVLKEIQSSLATATTDQQKDKIFRDFLYKYNQDDGAMNSEYLYVIGKNDSQMVESFTEASRKLNEDGTHGGISGLVVSEYGVHIVYYAGKVENTFNFANVDDVNFVESDIEVLTNTLLNPLNNKTLFDKVYATLSISENTSNQAMYLNVLKEDLKITKFKSAYKDLLD